MALGGGMFITQNKVLPGSYINFVSASSASATISDRGYAAMALELDWDPSGEVFTVTSEDFQKNSLKIFGYSYDDDKLKGLRDLFKNITTGYFYRLNPGVQAACTYAKAKYSGTRGNSIKIVITKNVDNTSLYDVTTFFDTTAVDTQTVSEMSDLADNDYVTWITTATIAETAGTSLTGGTNATSVTGTEYQDFLDAIESYSFNALGCVSTTTTITDLFVSFTKRMRDEMGVKFQTVVYQKAADYEGIVNVANAVTDDDASSADLVYWVTGIIAGCAINKSNTNKLYDGEFTVDTSYTQSALKTAVEDGKFIFRKVGNDVRVLLDINSLVTTSDTKGDIFKNNQTIRVMDQIANDIATLFNTKYLGSVPNDASGRTSLWNDIVKHHQNLESIRAIENFDSANVIVSEGDTKTSVVVSDTITVVNAMEKLYMTILVE